MIALASVVYLLGMGGLGDNVFQRPFVKAQASEAETYLSTPWPELYADVEGLRFVAPWRLQLWTQQKNMARTPRGTWSDAPRHARKSRLRYTLATDLPVMRELERESGISLEGRWSFDLPDFGASPVQADRPVAVVRPVTIRREWKNTARAPRPGYVAAAATMLQDAGFYVVCVAATEPPHEWIEGKLPPADRYAVRGELTTPELLALIQNASVVVGGVGFIVPASIAAGTPIVCIGGGMGGHNAPNRITDPRMNLERARFILPDRYCRCTRPAHDCDKRIADFPARFRSALDGVLA